jgi:hypothetical protein
MPVSSAIADAIAAIITDIRTGESRRQSVDHLEEVVDLHRDEFEPDGRRGYGWERCGGEIGAVPP